MRQLEENYFLQKNIKHHKFSKKIFFFLHLNAIYSITQPQPGGRITIQNRIEQPTKIKFL